MKKLQLLTLAMLCAFTEMNVLHAKDSISKRWNKSMGRTKAKKNNPVATKAMMEQDDNTATTASSQEEPAKGMVGGPSTVAPQTFKPVKPFNGAGLVGNYFSNSQVATIHDPSGKNKDSYTFTDVLAFGSANVRPVGDDYVQIGTYGQRKTSGASCSACSDGITRLWGIQITDDQSAQ